MSLLSIGKAIVKAVVPTKAKLTNVVQTLKAAVTGQGVQANTPSSSLNKVLSSAASNPFTTAAVIAVAAGPRTALAAGKALVSSLSPKGKIIAAVAAPVVISAAIQSPKIAKGLITAPKSLSQFGGNVGKVIENPSLKNLKETFKDNPVISSAVLATGLLTVGAGAGAMLSNALNTAAVKANTKATLETGQGLIAEKPDVTAPDDVIPAVLPTPAAVLPAPAMSSKDKPAAAPMPYTPETQVIGKPISTSRVKRYKSKPKKQVSSQSMRVNIFNQSRVIGKYINARAY